MSNFFPMGLLEAEISFEEVLKEKNTFLPRINWSLIEIFEHKNSNRDYNFSKNEIAYERRCEKCPRFFTSDI